MSEPRPGPGRSGSGRSGDRSDGPWWSSRDDRLDPDQEPLAAHLAARGLRALDDQPEVDEPEVDEEPEVDDERVPDEDQGQDAHPPGICGVCPICRGHAMLQERHPEVAGHLADAARSLSLALARIADTVEGAASTDGAASGDGPDGPDRFRPIRLDDEGDVR